MFFWGLSDQKKRVRTENPLRSIKKDHQKIIKTKKVTTFWNSRKFWSKFSKIFEIFENFKIFRNFQKFWKFSENFKNFRDSTLTNFNFRSTQRIFLIFFYRSKWIFEADRTSLPEFAAKFTGKSYFTFRNCWTVKARFYIKYCPVSWNNTWTKCA